VPPPADEHDGDGGVAAANAKPPTHRCGYRPWRELLKRTFGIDVEQCDRLRVVTALWPAPRQPTVLGVSLVGASALLRVLRAEGE
ncbi:MAG: hypothetical protein JW751_28415, partial [Polyangiaceae bacterium]|nr:hypothetical protein [Polyangiaceae bacterium]